MDERTERPLPSYPDRIGVTQDGNGHFAVSRRPDVDGSIPYIRADLVADLQVDLEIEPDNSRPKPAMEDKVTIARRVIRAWELSEDGLRALVLALWVENQRLIESRGKSE